MKEKRRRRERINNKEKQTKVLKQELQYKRIEEQLKDSILQQKIENFWTRIEKCLLIKFTNFFFWH